MHMKAKAQGTRFDLCGVARAEPILEATALFSSWLKEGKHGDMDYLEHSIESRSDPQKILANAKSIIVLGLNYYQPPKFKGISIYAYGQDYHKVFEAKLAVLIKALKTKFPSNIFKTSVDYGRIFERSYAVRAGLGFLGKNRCLMTKEFGSWVLLATILTDLEIEADKANIESCPEGCILCLKACPMNALSKDGLDARKCTAYLTTRYKGEIDPQTKVKMRGAIWGCDICQLACPLNHQRQKLTKEPAFLNHILELPRKYGKI